jgi:NADH dehydrogenase (ubiquinone) 1 beta subcomplex subunit 3
MCLAGNDGSPFPFFDGDDFKLDQLQKFDHRSPAHRLSVHESRPCHSLQETPGQEGNPNLSPCQFCSLIAVYRDVWRYQGMFSSWERFRPKHTFPGLGIGTGAFIVYLAYDLLLAKPSHGGHGGHGTTHGATREETSH